MLYIEDLYLKGYRTIQGLQTTLKPGLNIIIGKNGTGKTNFMEFLSQVLRIDNIAIPEFISTLTFKNEDSDDIWELRIENAIRDDIAAHSYVKTKNQTVKFEENGNSREWPQTHQEILVSKHPLNLLLVFVKHGLPEDYSLIDKPYEFIYSGRGIASSLSSEITNSKSPHFLKGLLITLSFSLRENYKDKPKYSVGGDKNIVTKSIEDAYKFVDQLKQPLNKFTNIKGLRFHEGFIFSEDLEKGEQRISNLYLEFNINNQWLPFSSLSDGTKRLFYIISEIAIRTDFTYSSGGFGKRQDEQPTLVLLEEPELGIHPHLLFGLMQFLKESAVDRQIILTTHAPQVLDILNVNELDRVLIARLENGKTAFFHLTAEQKEKAADYMQSEAYLSDYWKYSDLEG